MKKTKNIKQSFERSALLLLLSSVLVKLIGALFKIPLASDYILGDLGFGYFASAHDLYTPIFMLASAGLPLVVSKIIAEYVVTNNSSKLLSVFFESKKLFLKVGLLLATVLTVIIFILSVFVLDFKQGILYFVALVPSLLICFIISVYRGYFEGIENINPVAVSNVIEAFIKLIFGLLFAFLVLKLTGDYIFAAAAATLAIAVGSLIALLYLKSKFKSINPKSSNLTEISEKQKIITTIYAVFLPVALSSMIGSIVSLIDALTVKPFISSAVSYEFLKDLNSLEKATFLYGVRSKAFTVYNLIPTFVAAILVSALPTLASAFTKGDNEQLKNRISKVLKFASIIIFPASLGLFALGENITIFLYGETESYILGGQLLSVFGLAAIFTGFSIILTTILQALDASKTALVNIIIGAVFKVVLNIVFVSIPSINIMGSAYSTLICYLIIFVLNCICLCKKIKAVPMLNSVVKPFLAAVICVVCAYGIVTFLGGGNTVFALSLVVAAVVDFSILIITKCITKEDYGKNNKY